MEQKSCLKLIYKLHSKQLKRAKWKLDLPLDVAMREYPENIVSLSDSQLLRFVDEINGVADINGKVRSIQNKIKAEKKKPKSRESKMRIKELYNNLYGLQFQKDYICVIMDSMKDYDRANQGFSVNGIEYRRFLGTNGGIKNSTIVYVNAMIYPELKKRLDNGRKMDISLVPAKLEAYQALICSGSTPIPQPNGIIVVKDCVTHFKDDIILINDESDGEPIMTFEKDYEIEHDDSDGYGLMLPSYSRRVNEYLTGDGEHTISGMNTRYAWTKGMVYTFDFIKFADEVAGTYEITDVWGDKRDIRNAEVILTESMLKLWDSYNSWEDYYENCQKNHYQFSTPKITPQDLENVRNTNYQFLQSYKFTDDELVQLCQPTIDEISGVLGLDYRKSIVFLAGFGLNDDNAFNSNVDYCIQALMIDENMINDSFIRKKIWNMIATRIKMAKRGAVKVNANYAMISGDPYALCQSMFGLEITGLLKAGEVYHKYWIKKGANNISCFRAPMTCHNNVRQMRLNKSDDVLYWFQYMDTVLILNAWDTACDAMNGADKDGDTNMCTDNPIIVNNTLNSPTIICVQRKAEKKIPTEEDIVRANKLAFNDDIGVVTNHVTSMIEVQAGFDEGSDEYKILDYRIMCGQLFQQNVIDRAKGIIAKPMPEYWYSMRANLPKDNDSAEILKQKAFNGKIAASKKPYFMTYVYPRLKTQNSNYLKNNDYGVNTKFFDKYNLTSIEELKAFEPKTDEMRQYLEYYERFLPTGNNPCVVNRICWIFEDVFKTFSRQKLPIRKFDYSILKSNAEYNKQSYVEIKKVYQEYREKINRFAKEKAIDRLDDTELYQKKIKLSGWFRSRCEIICPNEDELCNIVVDLAYQTEGTKSFAWDICGDVILKNLLIRKNNTIHYPVITDNDGDFEYCGKNFTMYERKITDEEFDNIKREELY